MANQQTNMNQQTQDRMAELLANEKCYLFLISTSDRNLLPFALQGLGQAKCNEVVDKAILREAMQ